jgi:hypothetical protein
MIVVCDLYAHISSYACVRSLSKVVAAHGPEVSYRCVSKVCVCAAENAKF